MNRTRLSLYYLAGYLCVGGTGFLLAPGFTTEIFLSNTDYSEVMVSAFGMIMVALGILVVQIIRFRLHVLYSTSLILRIFICICLLALYYKSANPFFLVLFGIVFIGVILTSVGIFMDMKSMKISNNEKSSEEKTLRE